MNRKPVDQLTGQELANELLDLASMAGHSPSEFVQMLGSPDWQEKIQDIAAKLRGVCNCESCRNCRGET